MSSFYANLSDRAKNLVQIVILSILITLVTWGLVSMGATKPLPGQRSVVFSVEASGGFSIITLRIGDTYTNQGATISVPWTKRMNIKTGTQVYLTALNPSQTGKLICKVTLDGGAWKTDTTDAPKDGVACAGIIP